MEKIKRITVFTAIVFSFSACTKPSEGLTKAQLEAKADSIFRSELPGLIQQAREDLKNRLPIELKPKIDSIRNNSYEIPPVPRLDIPGDTMTVLPPLPQNESNGVNGSGLKKAPPVTMPPTKDTADRG